MHRLLESLLHLAFPDFFLLLFSFSQTHRLTGATTSSGSTRVEVDDFLVSNGIGPGWIHVRLDLSRVN